MTTTQGVLFVDPASLAKPGQSTSREAAEECAASGRLAGQLADVLVALRERPGATSAELAERMGVDRHVTGRRLPDLARLGKVERGEARTCGACGRRSLTWWPA